MRAVLLVVGVALASPAVGKAAPDKADAKADAKKPDARNPDARNPDAKSDAKADKPAPPPAPPRVPGPDDPKVVAALDKLVAGPNTAARNAALGELDKLAGNTIDAIAEWLARPHRTDVTERRKILTAIGASVPDKSGKFSEPPRQTGKERKADDELDWMKALLALDPVTPVPARDPGRPGARAAAPARGPNRRAGSRSAR
jgi:hypothetical protein